MALFNSWRQRKARDPAPDATDLDDYRRDAGTKSGAAESSQDLAKDQSRKAQRSQRREILYAMIRENMVRMGALSPAYRFRVLSMDAGGREYVVMIDLAADLFEQPQRLADFEKTVAELASARHALEVTAVYWRVSEELTKAMPRTQAAKNPQAEKYRQELEELKDGQGAPRRAVDKEADFEATRMLDPAQSDGPVSDFAATQMIDFSQMDANRGKRRG